MSYINDMQNNISNVIVFDEKISTYVFYTKVTKTFYDMYMSQRNTAPILDFRKTKYITPEAIPVLLSFGDYLSRLYKRKIQIVYTRGSELHNFFMVSKFYEISQKLDIFEWDDVSYEWYYKELRKLHKISYTNIIYADVEKIKEPMQKRDFISDCLRDRSKVIYQNVLSDTNKLPENIIGASKKDVVGEQEYELRYIEIGSIGKILENVNGESYNNRFTVAICEQGKLCIHDYNYTAGEWEERNNQKYLNELSIVPKGKTEEVDSKDLPRAKEENSDHEKIDGQGKFPAEKEIYLCNRSEFLFEYLKKEGNYKEGHFHWKNKNKTLGWINIASFLGNIDILEKAKECIIEIFEKEMGDVQVVVGYGMEGNIIGSSLVDYWIENDKDYYFYPSVHKDNEHIDLEKSLWNEYNEYKNVLIICDMMPSMEYLAEILKSNTKLEACSKIYVLALFTNFNLLKQEQENKTNKIIRRYSLAKLNVPICEKDEENCLICKQNLGKIYSL